MALRKTTVTLPDEVLRSLRILAIERDTTMSALIGEAIEAYRFGRGCSEEPVSLDAFFDPSPEEARRWLVEVREESEDFDDADPD